ncbi:transcriptional repressor CTCFL-like [Microplitis mediator]|uniref:transcriptional repressor CTCFL-like n=1 Tax=Microplitis mediator TaxID=375433 RepID=UPI0025531D19|nr:transcriptional repressor CTCFL-like [Microplitis mediator]
MSNNLLHNNYEFPPEEIKRTEYQPSRVDDSTLHRHENINSCDNYLNNERVNRVSEENIQLMNNNNYLHLSSNEMSWEVEDYKIYDLDSIKLQPQKNNHVETNHLNSVTGNKEWDADDILQMIGDNSSLEIVENYEERKKIEYSNDGRNYQLENSTTINNDKFQKLTSDTNENSVAKTSVETKDINMTDSHLQVVSNPTTSTEQVNSTPIPNMFPVSYTDYYKNLFQVQPFSYHPITMNQMGQNVLPFIPIFPGLHPNFCLPMNYFPFIPCFTFLMPMPGIAYSPVNSVPEQIPVKPETVDNLSIENIEGNSINTHEVNNENTVSIETRDLQPKVLIEKIKSPKLSSTKQASRKSKPKKCTTDIIPKSDSQESSLSETKKLKIKSSKISKKKQKKNEYSDQNNAAEGFECRKCTYVATQLGNLKRHMAVHLEERPFKCLDCPFTTRYSYSLQCHIKRHSGERPFECDVCQSKFITSSNLNHHMFIAHKLSPSNASLKCKRCKMTFSNMHALNQHKNMHRIKHIYRCKLCFYTSTSSITFKNHVSKHDNPKIYICYDCGKQFVQKVFLEKHIINHHIL